MGRVDPVREDLLKALRLLWGVPEDRRRGPQPQLTVDQITATAIAVADEDGSEGLSIRAVAERLGVGAMSLYRYVPSKATLLALMVDRVSTETDRDASQRGWRARLKHIALENRLLYERHPWLLDAFTGREMGPGAWEKYEHELGSIHGIGLDYVEMDLVLTLVLLYVRGVKQNIAESRQTTARTGLDDVEWWSTIAPTLEQIADPDRFPIGSQVGTASSEHYLNTPIGKTGEMMTALYELTFEFGLERVLDGIDVLVQRKRRRSRSRARPSS